MPRHISTVDWEAVDWVEVEIAVASEIGRPDVYARKGWWSERVNYGLVDFLLIGIADICVRDCWP